MSIGRGRAVGLSHPSARLALLNDVMLERKHTRLLNASSLLERSVTGADGRRDKQLCSGSSSLRAAMWPAGMQIPVWGWLGVQAMHPRRV